MKFWSMFGKTFLAVNHKINFNLMFNFMCHTSKDNKARFKQQESTFITIKVSVKENKVPTEKILIARVFSLQRQVIYQIKAKRLNYLVKDFISSNFKKRLGVLLSNSEVSSLLLKLQLFRVVKYSLHFNCI